MRDRYLCQFQDVGKDYFITDCAFQDGQLNKAKAYVKMIILSTHTTRRGQVYDQAAKRVVHSYG